MSWLRFEASRLASFRRGHGAAKSAARQVVLQVVLTDVRWHCRCHCPAIAETLRGYDSRHSPDFLPDGSRPSRDRLAGLRAVFGELLASRKNLVLTRGKACFV